MTTAAAKIGAKLLTADDLLRLYSEGVRGELIRGVLHQTVGTGIEHGQIAVNFAILMGTFVKSGRLGRVVGTDVGIWLERDPDTVREPDLAFIWELYRKLAKGPDYHRALRWHFSQRPSLRKVSG